MMQYNSFQDRRTSQRTNMWNVVAKASEDRKSWFSVIIPNVSAGGLMFSTDKPYDIGDRLWFDLDIDPILPGIEKYQLLVQCEIKNKREIYDTINGYGTIFCALQNSDATQLNELIDRTMLV